jgi:hypothetical protein
MKICRYKVYSANLRKSRANENGDSDSSLPPVKRQKIVAASSSSSVSNGAMAARILQLEQRLQSAEEEVARLHPFEEEVQRLQVQEKEKNQRLLAMRAGMIRYGLPFNGKTTDVQIIDNLTRLSPLAVHYNANVTNQFIRDIPEMLWWQKILQPFLNLEDLSILRRTNTFFQSYWESVLRQNMIRVPQGCPTVEKTMAVAVVFSAQKVYTIVDPLQIQLDKGIHEIVGYTNEDDEYRTVVNVTCSHITFVGKGKDHTTIRGGFRVENQQNVKFEELSITNPGNNGYDCGLELNGSETTVIESTPTVHVVHSHT